MRVTINWEERIVYASHIEVDAEIVQQLGYDPQDVNSIQDFLTENEDMWFDQVEADRDFQGVVERDLTEAWLAPPMPHS